MSTSGYADRPWLALLDDAQRGPIEPADSLVHALRTAVAEASDRTFLAYFDARLSYRQVDELTDSVAAHLAARGLERGDRVAVLLQNSPHFVLAVLGAWKAGATVVPVNPMYKSAEVGHVLRDGEVTALVCSDRAWESYLRDTAARSPVRIVLTGCELDFQTRNDARVLRFERLPQAPDADDLVTVARQGGTAPADRDPRPDDIALISYTSGTSGTPKGATNTHGNIMHNAERQSTGLGLPEAPVYYALAPLFHITGMVCQFGACLNSAGTLALTYRFEPGLVLEAFAEHQPHYTVGPSTAFMALAAHPDATREHFASFVNISSGGAPVPPALVE
ncbi:class I adenylate-forming enzyme family protein, partial [Streptomyces broussonetiae]